MKLTLFFSFLHKLKSNTSYSASNLGMTVSNSTNLPFSSSIRYDSSSSSILRSTSSSKPPTTGTAKVGRPAEFFQTHLHLECVCVFAPNSLEHGVLVSTEQTSSLHLYSYGVPTWIYICG